MVESRYKTIPYEKGTETPDYHERWSVVPFGYKTIPYEKGTETAKHLDFRRHEIRYKTIPYEKGTETHVSVETHDLGTVIQDHPLREGD